MKCLITGGCGFIGSNLAAAAIEQKWDVLVFDNLSRLGGEENLFWLKSIGNFQFIKGDVRCQDIENIIKKHQPDVIFHLAGQVAMTHSLANPQLDFETNTLSTLHVLEAVRKFSPNSIVIYSSTNKVYGDLEQFQYQEQTLRYHPIHYPNGFNENITLNFHSPYGCSKGAADQYMLDYARMFGLKTIVFRHSSIFGSRQFSTYDQGWIGWFVTQALETRDDPARDPFTISGNGKQVRDVLFSDDIVRCYFKAVENYQVCAGEAFNIGGGYQNSLSILELLNYLEKELAVKLSFRFIPWRQSDQKVFIADISKAKKYFSWEPLVTKEQGLERMIAWIQEYV
jgi:CDP-paratose 2-epimerase